MTRLWSLALTMAMAAGLAGQPRGFAMVHATVVDVANGSLQTDRTILIAGDHIVSVGDVSPPTGVDRVDVRGAYVVPGFWDMHAHIQMTGDSARPLYVANGVTGVRDMGSDLDVILPLRAATASGAIVGPHIVAAGPILDDAPEAFPFRFRVRTAEEGAAAVRMLKARNVDFVKVHDRTPREAYFAIAAEARRQGLPLSGHVPRGVTFEEAIEAGQRSIEHLAGLRLFTPCSQGQDYRPELCRAFFETLAKRHVWQAPTLLAWRELMSIGTSASGLDPAEIAYASRALRAAWDANRPRGGVTPDAVGGFIKASELAAMVTKDMVRSGVEALAGCDGMIPGFCIHDELALMVRGGLTPLEALRTATMNPAHYFARPDVTGRVAADQPADLVLLEGNPLTDIANTRRIREVVVRGRRFDRPTLDALLTSARNAAN
jgi:imidazolonepropionase-like amidohydrolase